MLKHKLDLESAISMAFFFFFQSQDLTVSVSFYKTFAIKNQTQIGTFLLKEGSKPSVAWQE